MNYTQLFTQIKIKKSFLCVGLDTDIQKIPQFLLTSNDPIFTFNKEIIDATHEYTIAYKPNLAFYESRGVEGWTSLEKTLNYIREKYPEMFVIADAKRGDIGNTSSQYAQAFFETMSFDAVTVAPYMGEDSVTPFMNYADKWVILLALTSNKGAKDFQFIKEDDFVFESVINKSQEWGGDKEKMMYVVGATQSELFEKIRKLAPEHFLLVPGVGAQGGSLSEVAKYGMNKHCGLIVNSSRQIIYASSDKDFAEKARSAAKEVQTEMETLLVEAKLV